MEYREILKSYIARSELTLDEITERLSKDFGLDISKSYLSQVQNGKVNPASPEINKALALITGGDSENLLLAAHLNKAPEEIKEKFSRFIKLKELRDEADKTSRVEEAKAGYIANDRLVHVPLLGCVAAGMPIERIEHVEDIEYVEKSLVRDKTPFALRVKGDSMIGDFIADGDIVICVKQKEVYPHEIAVVAVNGDEATLKRVKIKGDIAVLSPSNPQMQPQILDVSQIEILGKVIEVRRRLK